MLLLRSLIVYVSMIITTAVFVPIAILLFPFPFSVRYGFLTQWARINLRVIKHVCKLDYQVSGRENIPKENGIIYCKHQSAWETLALQEIFPPQVWLLKRELLWLPVFGWGLALLEPIAINRSNRKLAMKTLIEQGTDRLKKGRWVVIFPEGTRISPGNKGNYKQWLSSRACRAQCRRVLAAARDSKISRYHTSGDRQAHRSQRPKCNGNKQNGRAMDRRANGQNQPFG